MHRFIITTDRYKEDFVNHNWDHVRFFLALAEHGTLTRAAKHLDVSHSTVLRRVNQFEQDLNTRLFEQYPDGYKLTPAGDELFKECSKIHLNLQSALHSASGVDHRIAGEIVITTSDTLAQYLLPAALKKIQDKHPNLQFHLQMKNQISNLNDREADIAVRPCKAPPEHLIGRKVGELKFCVVAAQSYAKRNKLTTFPADTEKHHFIMLDNSYAGSPFHRYIVDRLHQGASCTTVSNFTNAAAMARAGMGITVLPNYILQHEPALIELPLGTQIPSNDLWLLSHAELRNTDRIKLVKRLLFKELQERLLD